MDELEWMKENSPSTQPSHETTRRHRMQLRAAIAAEGAEGRRPRRRRARPAARHRVVVIAGSVVVLCALGAGIVALSTSGDDEDGHVGTPAASGRRSTSTTVAPTCSGPLPANFNIPSEFGNGRAGPAPESSDPVEPGQQVTHWSSDQATFEVRWPADEGIRKHHIPTPQSDSDDFVMNFDPNVRAADNGVVYRRSDFDFSNQPPECQTAELTIYGTDPDTVNALADAYNIAPVRITEPLVTTTKSAAAAPDVIRCPGPVGAPETASNAPDVKFVATVGGPVSGETFAQPDDALADFVARRPTLYQRGYQQLQLPDGSDSFVAEPRPGAVVTVVHVAPTRDGWRVTDWNASGC